MRNNHNTENKKQGQGSSVSPQGEEESRDQEEGTPPRRSRPQEEQGAHQQGLVLDAMQPFTIKITNTNNKRRRLLLEEPPSAASARTRRRIFLEYRNDGEQKAVSYNEATFSGSRPLQFGGQDTTRRQSRQRTIQVVLNAIDEALDLLEEKEESDL